MNPHYPLATWPVNWTVGFSTAFRFVVELADGVDTDTATVTLSGSEVYGFGNDAINAAVAGSLAKHVADEVVTDFAASSPATFSIVSATGRYLTGYDYPIPRYAIDFVTTGDPDTLLFREQSSLRELGFRMPQVGAGEAQAVKTAANAFTLTTDGNFAGFWCPCRTLTDLGDNRRIITRRRSSEFAPGGTTQVRLGAATTYDPRWPKVDGYFITDRKHALNVYEERVGMYAPLMLPDLHNTLEKLIEQVALVPEFRLYLSAGSYVEVRFRDEIEIDTRELATPVSAGGTRYDVALPLIKTSL